MTTIEASPLGGKWNEAGTWVSAAIPGEGDDVVLGKLSGKVEVSAEAKCRSLEASEYENTLKIALGQTLKVGASTSNGGLAMKLGVKMAWTGTGAVSFVSTSGTTEKITTAGISPNWMLFNGTAGVWEFQDEVKILVKWEVKAGELKTGGRAVTAEELIQVGGALKLGASVITLNQSGTGIVLNTEAGTFTAETSTLKVNGSGTKVKKIEGHGKTYNVLTIESEAGEVVSGFTVGTLNLNTAGFVNATKITKTIVVTVTAGVTANGKAGSLVKLESTTEGKPWEISKSSGTVSLNFLSLKDSHAVGGASWYAGTGSTSVSGNEGWKFENPGVAIPLNAAASSSSTLLALSTPTQLPLASAGATSGGVLALAAPTAVPMTGASSSSTGSLSLAASTQVPLAVASSQSTGALAVAAPTRVPVEAAASASLGSLALGTPTQLPFLAASSASSGVLALGAPTPVPLASATALSAGVLTLAIAASLPLAPAVAGGVTALTLGAPTSLSLASALAASSAALGLSTPTRVPLEASTALSGALLALSAATLLPVQASGSAASASLVFGAPTRLPVEPAASLSSASLALHAMTQLAFGAASASSSASLGFATKIAVSVLPAAATSSGVFAFVTPVRLLLEPAAAGGSGSLALSAPTRIVLLAATATSSGSLTITLIVVLIPTGLLVVSRAPSALLGVSRSPVMLAAETRAPTILETESR